MFKTILSLGALSTVSAQDDGYDGNAFANWVGTPGHAPVPPLQDEFYKQNVTNYDEYKPGDIIRSRPISVSGSYSAVDTAMQIMFRTSDLHGPTVGVASYFTPSRNDSGGNIVVFTPPEDAISENCAPTYDLFRRRSDPELQSLLSDGYSVIVPDYEGSKGSYSVGQVAANNVLDSIRAGLKADNFKPKSNEKINIGLWGFGMGAHAAGFAAEQAKDYAPELKIKTVVLGSPITNLSNWIVDANNLGTSSVAATSLVGMSQQYPEISRILNDKISPEKRGLLSSVTQRCSKMNQLRFFTSSINSLFFPQFNIFTNKHFKRVYNENSLGQKKPSDAIYYVYKGTRDTQVREDDVAALLKNYCSQGIKVNYHQLMNAEHNNARNDYMSVLDFLGNSLQGDETPSNCQRIKSSSDDDGELYA